MRVAQMRDWADEVALACLLASGTVHEKKVISQLETERKRLTGGRAGGATGIFRPN